MLGIEPPSVGDVNALEEVTLIHSILLSNNIVIVEGLTNLDGLREECVLFCAAPLKIEGGDGSPCRAFAIEGAAEGSFRFLSPVDGDSRTDTLITGKSLSVEL